MKALIIADSDILIDVCASVLKKSGYEIIIYRWLLKALDNIEEISPDVIILDASSYPRHWKIVVQSVASDGDNRRFFLFSEKKLSPSELRKADFLCVEKIFSLDSENISSDFALCLKQNTVSRAVIFSEPEEIECILGTEFGIITGHASKFDGHTFLFVPDYKSNIENLKVDSKIRNVVIKKIAEDKIFVAKAMVTFCNANSLELKLEEGSRNERF